MNIRVFKSSFLEKCAIRFINGISRAMPQKNSMARQGCWRYESEHLWFQNQVFQVRIDSMVQHFLVAGEKY